MPEAKRPRFLARLTEPVLAVGGLALVVMMGVTVADILGRHFVGVSVRGVVEIVEAAMVWCTFAGIGAAFAAGGHITVDLIDTVAGRRTANAVGRFARVVAVLGMVGLTWLGWRELLDAIDWGDTTVVLGLPHTVFWIAIFGGYAIGAVTALAVLVRPEPAS